MTCLVRMGDWASEPLRHRESSPLQLIAGVRGAPSAPPFWFAPVQAGLASCFQPVSSQTNRPKRNETKRNANRGASRVWDEMAETIRRRPHGGRRGDGRRGGGGGGGGGRLDRIYCHDCGAHSEAHSSRPFCSHAFRPTPRSAAPFLRW